MVLIRDHQKHIFESSAHAGKAMFQDKNEKQKCKRRTPGRPPDSGPDLQSRQIWSLNITFSARQWSVSPG